MELRDYLIVLRKRWISTVVVALVALLGAALATLNTVPLYEATTRVFFAVPRGESVSDLAQGSSFTEKQMSSYAQVATSPLVLGPVIDSLDLEMTAQELSEVVRASVPLNTVILEITATEEAPGLTARIANAVGAQLAEVVGTLYPERSDGAQAVLATTLTPATAPELPSSPNVRLNLALGLLVGLALGVGTAVLRESLDTKIRSDRDLAQVTDRSLLGTIVFDPEAPNQPVIMHESPRSPRAESVRRLRTNLQFVDIAGGLRSIVVTSSIPAEGKTTTSVNLAVALADAGARVILIDADLRRPTLAEMTGLEGSVGLTSVLIGRTSVADVVQSWSGSVDVLTSGPIPPNPSELLGSPAMAALLEQLEQDYDVVLLDSPPLLPVTDAAILAKRADGTLVVVGTDRIHKGDLRASLDSLEKVDAHVLGLVLNKVAQRDFGAYSYGYSYSYGTAADDDALAAKSGRRATRSRGRIAARGVSKVNAKSRTTSDGNEAETQALAAEASSRD